MNMSPVLKPDFAVRAKQLRVLIFDVDGVMTDGGLWFGPAGEALKRFHVRDGLGMVSALQHGFKTAILSGRNSLHVAERAKELRIAQVMQGCADKKAGLAQLLQAFSVDAAQCAFMGDDVNDLEALAQVGIAACPRNAVQVVQARCHFISSLTGGDGCVREFIDTVIQLR
jgi:3-deoxy-D-manno-octulosonate 8-phosphate phosphatase (KDO 8-P phosphatase)